MTKSCGPCGVAWRAVFACALALAAASPARAELMTYRYGGVVTRSDASTGVDGGAAISGSFAFDLAAGPRSRQDVPFGRIFEFGPADGARVSPNADFAPPSDQPVMQMIAGMGAAVGGRMLVEPWGSLTLTLYGPGAFGTGPGTPQTYLSVAARSGTGVGSISVQLLFLNTQRVVYPDLEVPTAIDLADFDVARFEAVEDLGRGRFRMLHEGILSSLSSGVAPSIVPEPASLLLLGTAAAAGLALRARRRRAAG